jgi:hypothetical protein
LRLQLQVILRVPHDFSVIATEVLSEGVDLRHSNIVIYYDIPWNGLFSASGA